MKWMLHDCIVEKITNESRNKRVLHWVHVICLTEAVSSKAPTSEESSCKPTASGPVRQRKQEAHGPHRSPEKTVQINKHI